MAIVAISPIFSLFKTLFQVHSGLLSWHISSYILRTVDALLGLSIPEISFFVGYCSS